MARYALVIGIAQYQSSQMSRLPKAASDAESLAQVLEQYGGFDVKRLPERWNAEKNCFEISADKAVTAAEVGQELRTLLKERATKNEALIYFAGHGFTFSDTLGQQEGVLAASNCQVEMAGKQVIDYKYGISLASLNDLIQQSDLSSLVMLLDCCHSGYFLESQLVQRTLRAFSTQRDYYLMAACRTFETAKSFKGEPNSYFTGAVLKGLASENAGRDRRVSGDRLFDYISGELKSFVQEPIRMGWGRSITLVTYPQPETLATEITFDRKNPYLGLSAFEAEQEKYFYGREEAIRTLITHLTNSRFLSILGYSGSGKSSLIKAGLLPQLSRDRIPGSSQWSVESFTPGKHPRDKLVDILARPREQNQPFVIFIDQFEEVFTLCEDEAERKGFIRLIAEEMKDTERKSRMIIALRGDFLSRCADYPEVLNLINHIPTTTYIVKSLGIQEVLEAIEKPAELHGVKFERGLVLHIAQDVAGQPGALPLLQYALKELWRVCIEKPASPQPLLTKKGYEEIGGVQGALENRANVIYQSFSDGDRIFVRKLFMELVQLGEGKEVTRRRVDWDRLRAIADSPEQLERVIGLLAGAQQRLVIADEKTVEVAHEALLCQWNLLSDWIEEDQENIRISRRLEIACREWEKTYGKSDEALLTGARLAEVEEWEKRVQPHLTGDEREFLGKSVGRRDRQIQDEIKILEREIKLTDEKLKAQKQRTRLAIVSGILLTFTLGLGLLTNVLEGQKREEEVSKVGVLIGKAQQILDTGNQLEAMVACLEALQNLKKIGEHQVQLLRQIESIILKIRERNRMLEPEHPIISISFDSQGNTIASGAADGTVKLWNHSGEFLYKFTEHKQSVLSVKFSPDGNKLASASLDNAIIIRNKIKKWQIEKTLKGHTDSVLDISFNPLDGNIIASGGEDGTLRLWNIRLGQPEIMHKESKRILRIDFAPNGKKIAFTTRDNYKVKIWDLANNKKIDVGQHKTILSFVKFSPNGNVIASSDYGGIINFWSSINYKLLGTIKTRHTGYLHSIAFSPNNQFLASSGEDGTIELWNIINIKKPVFVEKVKGHKNDIQQIEFSPNLKNRELVSAGEDGTVRLWQFPVENINSNNDPKIDQLILYSCEALQDYLKLEKSKYFSTSKFCKNSQRFSLYELKE